MVFGVRTYRIAEADLIQCIPKIKTRRFFWGGTTADVWLQAQAADPGELKQANAT